MKMLTQQRRHVMSWVHRSVLAVQTLVERVLALVFTGMVIVVLENRIWEDTQSVSRSLTTF